MKLTAQIEKEIDRHNTAMDRILSQLKQKILDLPDNPRINRINSKCFTMKFSDLNNNWTPVHHDFKAQYRYVVDVITKALPQNKIKTLKDIIQNKLLRINDSGSKWAHTIRLHPDVVNYLSTLV